MAVTAYDPTYTPPQGATLNEYGFWVLPSGDFAPGQEAALQQYQMGGSTSAQKGATVGAVQTDPSGKKYELVDGQKWYLPPGGDGPNATGGLIHGHSQWNPQTGEWDSPISWGNVLGMVAAGIITAGAADALLASTPALATDAAASGLPASAETATAGGVGIGETGATTGLASGAGLPGAVAAPVTGAAADAGAFDAAGNFIGDSTVAGEAAGGASTLSKIGSLLGPAASGIGAATTAAGNNALTQEKLGLDANQQNISGQSAFEQELMARAKLEQSQRANAGADVYRESFTTGGPGGTGPAVSPFNPAGSPKESPQYLSTLKAVGDQGAATLAKPAQYATTGMPTLAPYTPINPANVQGATNTAPSTLQQVGNWLAPGLTVAQKIAQLYGG